MSEILQARELREQSIDELRKELLALLREQFNLRIRKANFDLSKPTEIKKVRRNIARVKTVIKEKGGHA